MTSSLPRHLLIAESDPAEGMWRFALHSADGRATVAASDAEAGAGADRLALLAVVRGLEALDEASEVTIVTRNASLARGVRRGLADWRSNLWRWERHGRLIPIRDVDLWRRVDGAMRFHRVRCRTWRSAGAPAAPARVPTAVHEPRRPRPRIVAPTPNPPASATRLLEGRPDSPAMVIVTGSRSRRRIRFDTPAAAAAD
ncbi:MAG: hypothetical protein AAF805_15220 [Planctomycetota bacterium]